MRRRDLRRRHRRRRGRGAADVALGGTVVAADRVFAVLDFVVAIVVVRSILVSKADRARFCQVLVQPANLTSPRRRWREGGGRSSRIVDSGVPATRRVSGAGRRRRVGAVVGSEVAHPEPNQNANRGRRPGLGRGGHARTRCDAGVRERTARHRPKQKGDRHSVVFATGRHTASVRREQNKRVIATASRSPQAGTPRVLDASKTKG